MKKFTHSIGRVFLALLIFVSAFSVSACGREKTAQETGNSSAERPTSIGPTSPPQVSEPTLPMPREY